MNGQRGFTLLEVLVSLLLVSVGALGMAALQAKSLRYTQDAVQRNGAILLANQLLEQMRSNPKGALTSNKFTIGSGYYKAAGSAFASTSRTDCSTRSRGAGGSDVASADLACWVQSVKATLPVTSAILASDFTICPSQADGSCTDTASSAVLIRIAWQDPTGQCDDNLCTYSLRGEL
ncbi:type IV pilus modification protein PilV [Pseudomonas citronellolis]|uniref:type IV pilus modification protein PilV n=1 Tax=Pseudomonas citronellolis TaxID=53408 RepID=UPI0023E3F7C4|nr:type IV pilus modification protein PilV [Pseudomonas citronellolis]MDF3931617.1 type IV pilus modification protein PilV [Pseudomonas citronellolis]